METVEGIDEVACDLLAVRISCFLIIAIKLCSPEFVSQQTLIYDSARRMSGKLRRSSRVETTNSFGGGFPLCFQQNEHCSIRT